MPWDRKKIEGLNRPLRTSEPFLIITESTTAIHIFTSKSCVKPSKHLVASFTWHRSCHMNYISYIKDICLAEASYSHEIVLKTIVRSNKEILINLEPKSNWHYAFQQRCWYLPNKTIWQIIWTYFFQNPSISKGRWRCHKYFNVSCSERKVVCFVIESGRIQI